MSDSENQIKRMLLQATLIENLTYLKEKLPELYEQFKDYKPSGTGVVLDENGSINLLNNSNYAYEENPKVLAQKQVKKYLNHPVYSRYEIKHSRDEDIYFKHQALLKSIYNVRNSQTTGKVIKPTQEARLDFVCFLGGGLGYQIEELFRQKEVLNVLLFEPNPSAFYALLHCVELKPLVERCVSIGGVFRFCIGGDENVVVNQVYSLLNTQGFFNVSLIHFFKHYDSQLMTKTVEKLKALGHRWTAGWGFFEDEIIGLRHTLSNLALNFPTIKKSRLYSNPLKHTQVFVVANGPSLDLAIDFLKDHQGDLVIVSCGTALKALLINGIKPDFHVEMERTKELYDWLEAIEKDEKISIQLKDINIIALNTVYYGLLQEFKAARLITKVNDAGGELVRAFDKDCIYTFPLYTNPTVTNTALAVVCEMGFEEVYLVGVDLGFVSETEHHSKHSIYYDKDFKYKAQIEDSMKEELKVKGNFKDLVSSTFHFDNSRGNIESLIKMHKKVKFYNTSNGAFIRNTKPRRITDLAPPNKLANKSHKIEKLLTTSSSLSGISEACDMSSIVKLKHSVRSNLESLLSLTNRNFNTREELVESFFLQNKMLKMIKEQDAICFWLIQGTFNYFQSYIMACTYYFSDPSKRVDFINACIDAFHEHVNDIYIDFSKMEVN